MLRVGMAGAGMVSDFHLRAWHRRSDVAVVAIADPDLARATARARDHGIPAVYSDPVTMLDRERLHAMDVATPRETHASIVLAAARSGCAVLCQKPFAPTLTLAQELTAQIPEGARVMIHENWRFRPGYRLLARWLAEGRLGTVLTAHLTLHSSALIHDAEGRYPMLVRQPFIAGLDRLLVAETLIHHLDVLRWLIGPLTMKEATLARRCVDVQGEDRAILRLVDRALAPVTVDADLCVPGAPARATERLALVGSAGTIMVADSILTSEGSTSSRVAFDAHASYQQSFDDCIGHFVECLSHDLPFESDPADNLQTLAMVESAYELSRWETVKSSRGCLFTEATHHERGDYG